MSRTAILARVTAACRDGKEHNSVPSAPLNVLQKTPSELYALFVQCLRNNGTAVATVTDPAAIPAQVAAWLNQPQAEHHSVRIAPEPILQTLNWQAAPTLKPKYGLCETGDRVGISRAVAGIADCGALVLAASPEQPTSLAFLPDVLFLAVDQRDIVANLTQAMTDIPHNTEGGRRMPRAVNIITSASRTADIGGKIIHGAHGPHTLGVILY
ncbi:MAG: LUD domain-containing protein [Alphaproteobacteria bacterium]|nr:LUD domain-containing protein [Alphaproteobacteria bacterium]